MDNITITKNNKNFFKYFTMRYCPGEVIEISLFDFKFSNGHEQIKT